MFRISPRKWIILGGLVALLLFSSGSSTHYALAQDTVEGETEAEVIVETEDEQYIVGPTDGYTLEQPLGGKTEVTGFAEYINEVYKFSAGIIGIIAVTLIMFGGVRWVSAAGNQETIGQAKQIITGAIAGLVIMMFSYTILALINPRIVDLDFQISLIPEPPKVENASVLENPPPFCAAADDMSDIKTQSGINSVGRTRAACANLVTEFESIVNTMKTDSTSDFYCPTCTINVNSAWRSESEQEHLYQCYVDTVEANGTDGPPCVEGCSNCNLAAPACGSYHNTGLALDLTLSGVNKTGYQASSAGYAKRRYNNGGGNAALANNQNFLREIMESTGQFKVIASEWWHFNYYGGCS